MYGGWGKGERSGLRKETGLVLDTFSMRHLWDLLTKMCNR